MIGLRGEAYNVNEEQIRSWFDLNYAALTQRERVYLSPYPRNEALEHVLRYYRRTRNTGEWDRLREAEVDVSLVKDTYILSGSIDLIKDHTGVENTVEIVDFKSEKKIEVNAKADRDKLQRYRRQLEVYAQLVEERTGMKVSRGTMLILGVKGDNLIDDPVVQAKKYFTQQVAAASAMKYQIIKGSDAGAGRYRDILQTRTSFNETRAFAQRRGWLRNRFDVVSRGYHLAQLSLHYST